MGTRNLTSVILNGECKVAQYCQWDGYPSGRGIMLLQILRGANMDVLRKAISECRWATREDIDAINKNLESVRKSIPNYDWKDDYPEYHRDTGCDILMLILNKNVRVLKDDRDFLRDTLFCEYSYEVNLDDNMLRVYASGDTSLIAEFDLDNLPDNEAFISLCEVNE